MNEVSCDLKWNQRICIRWPVAAKDSGMPQSVILSVSCSTNEAHSGLLFGPAPVSVSLALSDAVTRALKDSLPSCSGFALIERTGDTSEIRTTPDAIVVIRSLHYGLCYEEYTGMQGKSDDQKDVARALHEEYEYGARYRRQSLPCTVLRG